MEINGYDLSQLEQLGKPSQESVQALYYVSKRGELKEDYSYRDPRTNSLRKLNSGQVVFSLTSYNYGKENIWHFSQEGMPLMFSSWKEELEELEFEQDCSILVKGNKRQPVWEPKDVSILAFDEHKFVIPIKSSGFVLMEYFGTISFANNSLLHGGASFVSDLFIGNKCFQIEFEREHRKFKWFIPKELPVLPV